MIRGLKAFSVANGSTAVPEEITLSFQSTGTRTCAAAYDAAVMVDELNVVII